MIDATNTSNSSATATNGDRLKTPLYPGVFRTDRKVDPKDHHLGRCEVLSPLNHSKLVLETRTLVFGVVRDAIHALLQALVATGTPNNPPQSAPSTPSTPASPNQPAQNLSSYLLNKLKPNSQGDFHEEQLQFGIVSYLLKDQPAGAAFESAMRDYISGAGTRVSYEAGVAKSLALLESKGLISKNDRTQLLERSFNAAQLDSNKTALYDDKGSANDKTVATMEAKKAAALAEKNLNATAASKPSATPPTSPSTPPATSNSTSLTGGFLWKPISETDKKLVVLLPKSISQNVSSVALYSSLPATSASLIETGTPAGIANEDRAHFRFKKQGRSYDDGIYVVVTLKSGETLTQQIADVSRRVEK